MDWDAIRAEYIGGKKSIRALADQYGVSKTVIGRKCKDEGWKKERVKVADKKWTKVENKIARTQAQELHDQMETIRQASTKYAQRLDELMDGLGTDPGTLLKDLRATQNVATALKTTLETLRDIYSIPNQMEAHRQEMERERLKLERERIELEKEKLRTEAEIQKGQSQNTFTWRIIEDTEPTPTDALTDSAPDEAPPQPEASPPGQPAQAQAGKDGPDGQ